MGTDSPLPPRSSSYGYSPSPTSSSQGSVGSRSHLPSPSPAYRPHPAAPPLPPRLALSNGYGIPLEVPKPLEVKHSHSHSRSGSASSLNGRSAARVVSPGAITSYASSYLTAKPTTSINGVNAAPNTSPTHDSRYSPLPHRSGSGYDAQGRKVPPALDIDSDLIDELIDSLTASTSSASPISPVTRRSRPVSSYMDTYGLTTPNSGVGASASPSSSKTLPPPGPRNGLLGGLESEESDEDRYGQEAYRRKERKASQRKRSDTLGGSSTSNSRSSGSSSSRSGGSAASLSTAQSSQNHRVRSSRSTSALRSSPTTSGSTSASHRNSSDYHMSHSSSSTTIRQSSLPSTSGREPPPPVPPPKAAIPSIADIIAAGLAREAAAREASGGASAGPLKSAFAPSPTKASGSASTSAKRSNSGPRKDYLQQTPPPSSFKPSTASSKGSAKSTASSAEESDDGSRTSIDSITRETHRASVLFPPNQQQQPQQYESLSPVSPTAPSIVTNGGILNNAGISGKKLPFGISRGTPTRSTSERTIRSVSGSSTNGTRPTKSSLISSAISDGSLADPNNLSSSAITTPQQPSTPRSNSVSSAVHLPAAAAPTSTDISPEIASFLSSPNLNLVYHHPSGLQLSYATYGHPNGHPIMVFLGLGSVRYSAVMYSDYCRLLGLRMIVVERWGIGRTAPVVGGESNRSFLLWAQIITDLANYLLIPQFSILAHSAGTPYALATAIRYPERVFGGVKLLAPWAGVEADGTSAYKWLKYVPSSIIKTYQAADYRMQGWLASDAAVAGGNSPAVSTPTSPNSSHHNSLHGNSYLISSSASSPHINQQRSSASFDSHTSSSSSSSNGSSTSTSIPTYYSHSASGLTIPTFPAPPPVPPKESSVSPMKLAGLVDAIARCSAAESLKGGSNDLLAILKASVEWGFKYEDMSPSVPVEIWWGDKDERIGEKSIKFISSCLPNCKVNILKGAGHNLLSDTKTMIDVLEGIARDVVEEDDRQLSLLAEKEKVVSPNSSTTSLPGVPVSVDNRGRERARELMGAPAKNEVKTAKAVDGIDGAEGHWTAI